MHGRKPHNVGNWNYGGIYYIISYYRLQMQCTIAHSKNPTGCQRKDPRQTQHIYHESDWGSTGPLNIPM